MTTTSGRSAPPDAAMLEKKNLLLKALSYVGRFKGRIVVVKYGGAAMVDKAIRASFSQDMMLLHSLGMRPVIVHGGGPEVNRVMEAMGHQPRFVEGLRVTSQEGLHITEMVLSGAVNKGIVAELRRHGGNGVGLSGKDGHLLTARRRQHPEGVDLGQVGEIVQVDGRIVRLLLEGEFIPVISPLAMGDDGQGYNINADTAAAHIAAELKAEKLIFMTDVSGVLKDDALVSSLSAAQARTWIQEGVIAGGMIPKLEAILHALAAGVDSAAIINGNDPHAIIAELFTDKGLGTIVST